MRLRRALALLLLVPLVAPAAGDEGAVPARWRWLAATPPVGDELRAPAGLGAEARALAETLLPSTLALVLAPAGLRPEGFPVVGAGVVVREDGLVVASWQVVSGATRHRWLWARPAGGEWIRALPSGATWWGDVGLVRLTALRRRWPAVRTRGPDRADLRSTFLAVGAGLGRHPFASEGRLEAIVCLDREAPGGRRVADRAWRVPRDPASTAVLLHLEEDLAPPGSPGTPVFDLGGTLVGLVSRADAIAGRRTVVFARPWTYLEPLVGHLRDHGRFDPPDLGLRFAPAPRAHGEEVPVPEALARARGKVREGVLVDFVHPDGPANRILWEGDVVLTIEGRPVFAESYESVALAVLALTPGVPTDLEVLRGGRPVRVQLATRRARDLGPEPQATHDAEVPRLPRAR